MPHIHVTHHALVRFLERVRGFKFDREIAEIQKVCAGVTNGRVKALGHTFTVKDGCVITIAQEEDYPCRSYRDEIKSKTLSTNGR